MDEEQLQKIRFRGCLQRIFCLLNAHSMHFSVTLIADISILFLGTINSPSPPFFSDLKALVF